MVKKVFKYCLPTMFSLMMISLYGVIDGIFIGNYVGDNGLAAINIAWPLASIITALGVGIGLGGSVLISFKRSSKDNSNGEYIFQICFTTLLIFAVIITSILMLFHKQILELLGASDETFVQAQKYGFLIICGAVFQIIGAGIIPILRNYNMAIQAMVCMVTGTIMNIIINYILICILKLGISGAAIGTVTSQLLVSIIAISILQKKVNIKIKIKWNWNVIKRILKIAVTGFGISIAPSIVLIFTNLQCLKYGGDSAVACYCVIAYITFPVQSLLTGVGDGTQPLISYYAGANDTENLNKVVKIARIMGVILSIILTVTSILLSKYIPDLFGLSDDGTKFFHNGMMIYATSFIFIAMFKFNLCYLNACLKTKKAIVLTLSESVIITPILLYSLPLIWEINGIWLSAPLSAIVMLFLYYIWKD